MSETVILTKKSQLLSLITNEFNISQSFDINNSLAARSLTYGFVLNRLYVILPLKITLVTYDGRSHKTLLVKSPQIIIIKQDYGDDENTFSICSEEKEPIISGICNEVIFNVLIPKVGITN